MHWRLAPVSVALLLWALSHGAAAQEYCVTCTGPDATYRCVIGGEASAAARSARAQFLCITELAKAGAHASCSAARGQNTPCPGETRTVMFSLADPGAPPPHDASAPQPKRPPPMTPAGAPAGGHDLAPVAVPPPEQQQTTAAPPPADTGSAGEETPPKQSAVEEFADKTGKAVNDTGKAVGHAVKKSWDCVTSLFGDC